MPLDNSQSLETGSGTSASVSVCVVSAGRPELADLLDSLSKQDAAPEEVLVLVDTNTSLAQEIEAAHAAVDVGVFSGLTLGAARNRLVERASGDLLVFLDDDSVAPPEFVANLVDLAAASPDVGVFGGPNLTLAEVDRREALVGALLASRLVTGPFARRFRESLAERMDTEGLVLCNLAVRRAVWQPFAVSLREGEETEFLHRLSSDGVKVVASPVLMVWHRRRRTFPELFEQMRRYGRGRSVAGRERITALVPVATGTLGVLLAGLLFRRRIGLLLSYDPSGRITSTSGSEDWTLDYDAAGQLISSDGPSGSNTYSYDAVGNLTAKDGLTYSVDDANQLVSDSSGGSYTYDEGGRLTGINESDGTVNTYTYDARGLLIEERITTSGTGDPDPGEDICANATPTIVGTEGDDVIDAGSGTDVIFGLGGNDIIDAGSGSDIVCGGDGDDQIIGGSGVDELIGGAGNDTIDAGPGLDTVYAGSGADTVDGGGGADTIFGWGGDDTLSGGTGADEIDGEAGTDTIDGGTGSDTCETEPTRVNCEHDLESSGGGGGGESEETVISRTYDGDDLLVAVSVAHPDGSVDDYELVWDRTVPIPQVVSVTLNGATTDLVYGPNRAFGVTGGVAEAFEYSVLGDIQAGPLTVGGTFDPYGSADTADPTTVGFGYRGELHAGSLVYLRFRDLAPELGRFTTVDPLNGVEGTTTVANQYAYAGNDPIQLVDPLGLRPTDTFLCGLLVGAAQNTEACSGFAVPELWRGVAFESGQRFLMWRGKPDASNVIVYVPGVGTDTGNVNRMSIRGNNLFEAGRQFADDDDLAVVVALPYDPYNNLLTAGFGGCSDNYCNRSGDEIFSFLDSALTGSQNVTVVGHSLGSSQTGYAFKRHPELADKVDQFLIVGSPGVPFERAYQIGTDVAVSIAEDDAIRFAGNPYGHNECRVVGRSQVCDRTHPWDPEFIDQNNVLSIPNQSYAGRVDGIAAHGVYLDDSFRARQLVNWAYIRSFIPPVPSQRSNGPR